MMLRHFNVPPLWAFVCFFFIQYAQAQTIIFSSPGSSYNNTDAVTTDVYGPVNVSNCSSISFSVDYNFSLPFIGSGNMESSNECPFGIPPCQGDPNDPAGGGCSQCWDFFYVQFQIGGVTVHTELVGVPGNLNQSGTLTYGPICTNGAANAGIVVQTQTWAADESITFSNINMTCWEMTLDDPPNITVCANEQVDIPFTGTGNPTINWTNSNTGIGLGANGTGDIGFTAAAVTATTTSTVTATPSLNGCAGPSQSFTITVKPVPVVSHIDSVYCDGEFIYLLPQGTPGATATWVCDNPAGIGLFNGFMVLPIWQGFCCQHVTQQEIGIFTMTPTLNGCTGLPIEFTITINPLTSLYNYPNQNTCSGEQVDINIGNPDFTWTNSNPNIGLPINGMGDISFTAANVVTPTTGIITVTPGDACGPPPSFVVTVSPIPSLNQPNNVTVCAGLPLIKNFMGFAGATYSWTNDNTAIGLAAAGMGNLNFIAANVSMQQVANITVTPAVNGCTGAPVTFTITVNPGPTLAYLADQTVCSNEYVDIQWSGTGNTTFNWTNSNTAIGLGAAGIGNINFISAQVLLQETGNITVAPTLNGCPGDPAVFTITVNPQPEVDDLPDQIVCSGDAVDIPFNGNGSATYNWTNTNTAIGLDAVGSGAIHFIAATLPAPANSILTVTPTENGCSGPSQTISITVNPAPAVADPPNQTVCSGTPVTVTFLGSNNPGFSWVNSNTGIGLSASGSGNLNFQADSAGTGTITVTPFQNGCSGPSQSFDINVIGLPSINQISDGNACAGDSVAIPFTGTAGAAFSWTNNNLGTGLGASGNGAIGFTAAAVGFDTTGTIIVTPSLAGCTGAAQQFDLSIHPLPVLNISSVSCAVDLLSYSIVLSTSGTIITATAGVVSGSGGNFTISDIPAGTNVTITSTIAATGCLLQQSVNAPNCNCAPVNAASLPINQSICEGTPNPALSVSTDPGNTVDWYNTATGGTLLLTGNTSYTPPGVLAPGQYTFYAEARDTASNCSSSTRLEVILTVNAVPALTPTPDQIVCAGTQVTVNFTGTPSAAINWTNANPNIGLAAAGLGNISFPGTNTGSTPLTANIVVTPSLNGCSGTAQNFTITVNPVPSVTQPANPTQCAGTLIAVNFAGTGGATFDWTNSNSAIGLGANGTGNFSFIGANISAPTLANLSVSPSLAGCTGPTQNFSIVINPVPDVAAPADQSVCHGTPVMLNLDGTNGATLNWTNSNPNIGLAATGTGNTSFTGTNTANTPLTANIVVTPSLNGCIGTAQHFTITVNPVPSMVQPANQTYCAGTPVAVNFSGTGGATFDWTNSNPAIGLVANGTGNISFVAANINAPTQASLSVSPSLSGCTGPTENFSITINPVPGVAAPADQTVCHGIPVMLNFAGTSGATLNWTNTNAGIGLAAAGTGNISFTGINTGNTPLTGNLLVSPVQNGCTGTPQNFSITINPLPNFAIDSTVCSSDLSTYSIYASSNANTLVSNFGTVTANGSNFTISNIPDATNVYLIFINTATGCSNQQTLNGPNCSCPPLAPPNGPNAPAICEGNPIPGLMVNVDPGLTVDWYLSPTGGVPVYVGSTSYIPPDPLLPGVYTFYAESREINSTCTSSTRIPVILTVNAVPVANISGNTVICNGDASMLTASGGTSVHWSTGENTPVITINPGSTTTYMVTVSENGCTAGAGATVVVLQPTASTIQVLTCDLTQVGTTTTIIPNAAGCDSTITTITTYDIPGCTLSPALSGGTVSCFGDTDGILSLSTTGGNAPYQYNWSNGIQTGTGQMSDAGSPVQIQHLAAGTYTVTISSSNGLSSTVSAVVTSPSMLTALAAVQSNFGQNALSCIGATDGSIMGSATGGTVQYQYSWGVPGQNTALLTGVGAGTYTLTVTDAHQCTATNSATILDPPPLTFDIALDVKCGENAATSLLTPSSGVQPFSVAIDGLPAPGGLTPDIPVGNHLIEISDVNGCKAEKMVVVTLPVGPMISLPAEARVSLGETLSLNAQTNLTSWQNISWMPTPDSTCPNCLQQVWKPNISQVYKVVITDNAGCTASASVRVILDKKVDIYIPNVFSPNTDGSNDFWTLYAGVSVLALNTLHIFDRWGELLYILDAPVPVNDWPGWDGNYRGEPVNPGVYVYYLELELVNGEKVIRMGDLTVIR